MQDDEGAILKAGHRSRELKSSSKARWKRMKEKSHIRRGRTQPCKDTLLVSEVRFSNLRGQFEAEDGGDACSCGVFSANVGVTFAETVHCAAVVKSRLGL